jgi:hypothetical protein
MTSKTTRFMAELSTAMTIQQFANARGIIIDIEKSHDAWAEHSDDYCAGWLAWRDEDPTSEILQALTKWQERHGKLPVMPRPPEIADFGSDDPHAAAVMDLHRSRQARSNAAGEPRPPANP